MILYAISSGDLKTIANALDARKTWDNLNPSIFSVYKIARRPWQLSINGKTQVKPTDIKKSAFLPQNLATAM